MKKLNSILNIMMAAFGGVFVGRFIYTLWNYKSRPGLYAMQSAPWYTSILVDAGITIVVLLICAALKALIKHRQNKKG